MENKFAINNGMLVLRNDLNAFDSSKDNIVYEVIRIIDGKPLFFKDHMKRLFNSCAMIKVSFPYGDKEVLDQILFLSKENNLLTGNIKLLFNSRSKEVQIFFIPHSYPKEEQYLNGVKCILYYGERTNPNAKIINESFRDKVNALIKENSAYEAILVDNEGYITEGSRSNIFMIKGDKVYTAPVKAVLPGITRKFIIDLIKHKNFEFEEKEVTVPELMDMDALFISGTSPKILPIERVDNIHFDSSTNNVLLCLKDAFDDFIIKDIESLE